MQRCLCNYVFALPSKELPVCQFKGKTIDNSAPITERIFITQESGSGWLTGRPPRLRDYSMCIGQLKQPRELMPMFSGHLDILCETLFIASYPWSVKAGWLATISWIDSRQGMFSSTPDNINNSIIDDDIMQLSFCFPPLVGQQQRLHQKRSIIALICTGYGYAL